MRFLTILLALFPLAAQVAPTAPQTDAPPRVGVGVIERRLSLREAVEMALAGNLEIEIQKTGKDTAAEAVRGARGFWDPSFRWMPALESRNTPAGSVLQGASGKLAEHFHSQNFYFRQKTPWRGAQFGVDFENNRSSSTNPFVSLNPLTTSRLVLSFTQPLLRNRLIDRERAELLIRRKQVDISAKEFEAKVIDVITRVVTTYQDLVAARQDAVVKADSAEWARQQLARNRRMIESGSLAPVELSASEAELERRLDTWYASLGTITEVENSLKLLLARDRNEGIWSDAIVPTDENLLHAPAVEDLRNGVAKAIGSRPEIDIAKQQIQVNEIQKKQNADQLKPQVNLVASYINTGLAGSLRAGDNPFTSSNVAIYQRVNQLSADAGLAPIPLPSFGSLPGLLIGGYGGALSNLFGGHFPTYQAGLAFDFNIRNNTAEANLAQSVIAERRLKLQQAQVEQVIEAQVRNSLQALETARQRITAAEAGARAAQEKLESEVRLFQTGESTNFLVLTRQNESADSRHRAVAARLDFNKAVARLEQALGMTLGVHQVVLK